MRGPGPSFRISAGQAAPHLSPKPSSAGDAWLWEGSGACAGPQGQCSLLPVPLLKQDHSPPHPGPWSSGVCKYCKNFLAGGERGCLSFFQRFLSENTAPSPAFPSGWSSGEATSMLPPPVPPVTEPLKWRLIFQSV